MTVDVKQPECGPKRGSPSLPAMPVIGSFTMKRVYNYMSRKVYVKHWNDVLNAANNLIPEMKEPHRCHYDKCRISKKTVHLLDHQQCSPEAPAAGVFAGYSCIKRRLLTLNKNKEKLSFSFCKIISHVACFRLKMSSTKNSTRSCYFRRKR